MRSIGIQIKGAEAILVVLEKDENENIVQTNDSVKFKIDDPTNATQVKQFRDQINSAFDLIKPDRIAIVSRNANAKGDRTPSPVSFKLEGIIQLYEKVEIQIVWKQTTTPYFKKHPTALKAKNKYQDDAFEIALYLLVK